MRKWLPLAPPDMPGVWGDVVNMIPTRSGSYYAGNLFQTVALTGGAAATPGSMRRAWVALLPDDSTVLYVGTDTKLWQRNGAVWTDRSVGAYTSATDWSFAQYGNITLATNRVDALQTRDSTGVAAFANAAGSPPKARIIVTQAEQVVLFDLNDGAEKPDAFAACAPGDYTDWSGAGATAATRIRHRPGKITAAVAFKDYILVFKKSSVYRLTYTGNNTYKWRVELIATGRGAWGKHDVVNCGDIVVFRGPGGAWIYDGGRFQAISDYFGEGNYWLGGSGSSASAVGSTFNPISGNVVFWGLVGAAFGSGRSALVYNTVSDAWGFWIAAIAGSGGGSDAFVSTLYRPVTGEPAALTAFVGPTPDNADRAILISLASSPDAIESTMFWGSGAGTGVLSASVMGGIAAAGGRGVVNVSEVNPAYTNAARDGYAGGGAPTLPGDTELRIDVVTADAQDAVGLIPAFFGSSGYALADGISSTAQRRFDVNVSAPFVRFKIKAPSDSGYFEVADYDITAQPDGEL